MKHGKFSPRPGEFFRWHYDHKNILCESRIGFWSFSKCEWIVFECAELFLLVSLTEEHICFLHKNELIYMNHNDTSCMRIFGIPDKHKGVGIFYNEIHIRSI